MAMRPCLISAFWNHLSASGEVSWRILAPRGGHLLPVSTETPKASLMEEEAERAPEDLMLLIVLLLLLLRLVEEKADAEEESRRVRKAMVDFMVSAILDEIV